MRMSTWSVCSPRLVLSLIIRLISWDSPAVSPDGAGCCAGLGAGAGAGCWDPPSVACAACRAEYVAWFATPVAGRLLFLWNAFTAAS